MIELSSKALRLARLVAEHQPPLVGGAQVQNMLGNEIRQTAGSQAGSESPMRYVPISDDTALFYLEAIETFLQSHNLSASSDWDGNDLQYLQTIKRHLARSLALDAFDGGWRAP